MHAGENCSGLQAAGSFVKAPNGYHFLRKPSTERKKKKDRPSFVYSHTHMLTYVPVKYQNPDNIPAQVFRLVLCQKYQRLSPPPPPPPPLVSENCHLKERKKERNHHHQFFLSHTQRYMSLHHLLLLLVLSGSVKLDNSQKKLKFFQNTTQFQQNHPPVVGTVDSFFCEFQKSALLSQLPYLLTYCKIQAKVRGAGC